MFSIVVIIDVFYTLAIIFFTIPYFEGGFQQFSEFNKTLPYFQCGMDNASILASLLIAFFEIITYLLMIICTIEMVKYVNSHSGFDENLKIMVKQLTKTLIILSVVPLVKHAEIIILILIIQTNNNTANIIRLFFSHWFHFTPVFNSIVCILTNKPYRNAVFKNIKIFPQ
nr:unnamed protein product [Meloidogyne enterolobii]